MPRSSSETNLATTGDTPSAKALGLRLFELAHEALLRSMDELTESDLWWQPADGANSIAWLAWHLSRWKDRFGSGVSGLPQIWVSEGWYQRFGVDRDRTGLGDTSDQVAAFKPDRHTLTSYVVAAHEAVVSRVASLDDSSLIQVDSLSANKDRLVWQGFANIAMDYLQHTGQVAYLRGMLDRWKG